MRSNQQSTNFVIPDFLGVPSVSIRKAAGFGGELGEGPLLRDAVITFALGDDDFRDAVTSGPSPARPPEVPTQTRRRQWLKP